MRDRQGAPPRPFRPRQSPLHRSASAAQGAPPPRWCGCRVRCRAANTALAQAFEVEVETDPIAYDNVVPMSQRLSLLDSMKPPATGRSAIPRARNSSSAAARRWRVCPTARTIRASPTSPPPTAGASRRSRGGKGLATWRGCCPCESRDPYPPGRVVMQSWSPSTFNN